MAEVDGLFEELEQYTKDVIRQIGFISRRTTKQVQINRLIKTVDDIKHRLDFSIKELVYIDRDYPGVPQQPLGFTSPDSKRGKYDKPVYSPGSAPLQTGETPRAEPPSAPKKAGRRTRRQQRRKPKH